MEAWGMEPWGSGGLEAWRLGSLGAWRPRGLGPGDQPAEAGMEAWGPEA